MQNNTLDNSTLCKCIERIEKWYSSDTIILLDCVLTDSLDEPEYSANTAYNRLEEILLFQNLYYKSNIKDVRELLKTYGYSDDDIELLKIKMLSEDMRHKR